jgi:hypothetical protein
VQLSIDIEESPLLEAITRGTTGEDIADWKDLACAVVICKVWRLAMALQLSVVTSHVLKVVNKSNLQSKTHL